MKYITESNVVDLSTGNEIEQYHSEHLIDLKFRDQYKWWKHTTVTILFFQSWPEITLVLHPQDLVYIQNDLSQGLWR